MANKQYRMSELRAMSDEALKVISLQINAKGNYSVNANNAMRVRNERAGVKQFEDIPSETSFEETLYTECGIYVKEI